MNSLNILYKQYYLLADNLQKNSMKDFTTNLLQYGIRQDYFDHVNKAAEMLCDFYDKYLTESAVSDVVTDRLHDERAEGIRFCMLIDVLRCYDGLGHPTTFTTPEGIALMILLDKVLGMGEIANYEQLASVNSAQLSLIDIIPYINECSDELGNTYSLFMSPILEQTNPSVAPLYRKLLYILCKRIAEVDGVISLSEKEWLNEIALLNDDDPDNDIDISNL